MCFRSVFRLSFVIIVLLPLTTSCTTIYKDVFNIPVSEFKPVIYNEREWDNYVNLKLKPNNNKLVSDDLGQYFIKFYGEKSFGIFQISKKFPNFLGELKYGKGLLTPLYTYNSSGDLEVNWNLTKKLHKVLLDSNINLLSIDYTKKYDSLFKSSPSEDILQSSSKRKLLMTNFTEANFIINSNNTFIFYAEQISRNKYGRSPFTPFNINFIPMDYYRDLTSRGPYSYLEDNGVSITPDITKFNESYNDFRSNYSTRIEYVIQNIVKDFLHDSFQAHNITSGLKKDDI